jgi:urea transport system permease protein
VLRALRLLWTLLALGIAASAHALSAEQARAIAAGETDDRIAALNGAAAAGDTTLARFVQALLDDAVKLTPAQVLIIEGDHAVDAATGVTATVPADAEDVINNNRMRGALQAALASLRLLSPEREVRAAAVAELSKQSLDEAQLPMVDKAWSREDDPVLKARLGLMRAGLLVASVDAVKRLEAASALGDSDEPAVKALLGERLAPGVEPDANVRAVLQQSLDRVSSRLAWGERLGVVFTGLSLGSILLLVALGLAITYGLMGVINMAHGELMMVGAYATYVVQNLVRSLAPGAFDYYLWLAVPASFVVAALVGAVLERSVIRWLYGRPLETLLAT